MERKKNIVLPDTAVAIAFFMIGLIVAGTISILVIVSQGSVYSVRISYDDLAALLLTAVAVIVTCVGVVLAALAVWGYSQFKVIAERSATEHVSDQLRNGKLRVDIAQWVETHTENHLSEPRIENILTKIQMKIAMSRQSDGDDKPIPLDDDE